MHNNICQISMWWVAKSILMSKVDPLPLQMLFHTIPAHHPTMSHHRESHPANLAPISFPYILPTFQFIPMIRHITRWTNHQNSWNFLRITMTETAFQISICQKFTAKKLALPPRNIMNKYRANPVPIHPTCAPRNVQSRIGCTPDNTKSQLALLSSSDIFCSYRTFWHTIARSWPYQRPSNLYAKYPVWFQDIRWWARNIQHHFQLKKYWGINVCTNQPKH